MMNKKNKKKLIITLSIIGVLAVIIAGVFIYAKIASSPRELTVGEANSVLEKTLENAGGQKTTKALQYIIDNSKYEITELKAGSNKNYIATVKYSTIDAGSVIKQNVDEIVGINTWDEKTNMYLTSLKLKIKLNDLLLSEVSLAPAVEGTTEIIIYDMDSEFKVYTSTEVMDTLFGGIATVKKLLPDTYTSSEGKVEKTGANITNGIEECFKLNYDKNEPDPSIGIIKFWNDFKDEFHRNFIKDNNWKHITTGLVNTLLITFLSVVIGIILGFLIAIIRVTKENTGKLGILDGICQVYLTIVRGTPVLVQLMIIYFVILMPIGISKFITAVICFGLNSGAYVAEIVRGGIMSVDEGQMEAGRSLGFGYSKTMLYVIMPQAFKAVLPSLANEFIVLLKETSVSSYIGLVDLARGGDIIRGVTYSPFMPLLAVALIYLVLVIVLSKLVKLLEKKLNASKR